MMDIQGSKIRSLYGSGTITVLNSIFRRMLSQISEKKTIVVVLVIMALKCKYINFLYKKKYQLFHV